MHLPQPPWRRSAVRAAAAFAAAALLTAPIPAAAADAAPSPKVDATLLDAVDGGGQASFFVLLRDRADLSVARKKQSHAAKSKAAYGELRAHAETGQRSLNSFLDRKKAGHQSFWIANAVKATGDEDLVNQLAARTDVAAIVPTRTYRLGERLVEVEARIALGTTLTRLARPDEGSQQLARAEALARTLPYPAGTRRAARASGLLGEA